MGATEQLEHVGRHTPTRTGKLQNGDYRTRHKVSLSQDEWPASPPGLTPRRDPKSGKTLSPKPYAPRGPQTPSPKLSDRPLRDGDRLSSGIKLSFPAADRQPGARITPFDRGSNDGRAKQVASHADRGSRTAADREAADSTIGGFGNRQNGQAYNAHEAPLSSRQRAGSMGDLGRAGSASDIGKSSGARKGGDRRVPAGRRGFAGELNARGGSAGELSALDDKEAVRERLERLKLEKERADELAAQMAQQAQALMDERARMKADNDDLKREHDMMVQRLQLLESLMQPPDELDDIIEP